METQSIVVIGGINVDIGARPINKLIARDSNPGVIQTSMGGVARNIAHNLSLLGEKPIFLSALGDDLYANEITEKCEEAGIDMKRTIRVPDQRTSTYLFIADEEGEMQLAVSDMRICEFITPSYLETQLSVLENAKMIVLDTNLPKETIEYILEKAPCPVMVDPVSVTKAAKLSSCLERIHTLKPNRLEAEALSKVKITDLASCRCAAKALLSLGLKRVFITMGEKGVLAAEEGHMEWVPCFKANMVNATGAGDAFMAAVCKATLLKKDLRQTALMGNAAAAITVESPFTISQELSLEALEGRMNSEEN